MLDAASGQPYWWNTETGKTSWQAPEQPAAAASDPPSSSARGSDSGAGGGLDNRALELMLSRYLLSPAAKFDYPAPSAAFIDLIEEHRRAAARGSSGPAVLRCAPRAS